MRPSDVGIIAIETYFPSTYVAQVDLGKQRVIHLRRSFSYVAFITLVERFDGAPAGKYTIGLGQKNMAFVEPYEDVNSLALTGKEEESE